MPSKTALRFSNRQHEAAAAFLRNVCDTGKLGPDLKEENFEHGRIWLMLWRTFPWCTLTIQLLWSGVVVCGGYFISMHSFAASESSDVPSTLSLEFWQSRLNVSPTVAHAVGWALFVLLSLYIREANKRYEAAHVAVQRACAALKRVVRVVRLGYPRGMWHEGDHDRVLAHLVAYPIALKMTLRRERDHEQLLPLLHAADVDDVVGADLVHLQCMRVVRAYLTAAEDDTEAFELTNVETTPPGAVVRRHSSELLDAVDVAAHDAVQIAHFRPAKAYINHLRIFLYIWMMFLPLAVVGESGWFTLLWSPLITYGVSMVFFHALALNQPFGFGEQQVKINQLCAQFAFEILVESFVSRLSFDELIDENHETPPWLEEASLSENPDFAEGGLKVRPAPDRAPRTMLRMMNRIRLPVLLSLAALTVWSALIIFLTWGLTRGDAHNEDVRWWFAYIPIDTDITGYISLGVFIMLGFWVNDAYARYWRVLQLWETEIRPKVTHFAFQLSMIFPRELWHQRDRERQFSHLAALPYVFMLHLRGSRDVRCLAGILSPKDITAVVDAPSMYAHVMHVLLAYVNKADANYMSRNAHMMTTFGSVLLMVHANVTQLEDALLECDAIRKFYISPAFTMHLQLYTALWLILLPFTMVVFNGFLSFFFIILIGYSVINLICVGHELAEPFGDGNDNLPLPTFCNEVKASVRDVYMQTGHGAQSFIREAEYDRATLTPRRPEEDVEDAALDGKTLTVRGSIRKFLNTLPSVPVIVQTIAIFWSVAAVLASWRLSFLWQGERRTSCPQWCSPIDVQSAILGGVGFGLFLILAFRASDGISRYNQGARTMGDLKLNLRNVALEIVHAFPDGTFHRHDKERIVAHLAQIPLYFRDMLLEMKRRGDDEKDGVLSVGDRHLFDNSPSPLDHLLRTVESYFITSDVSKRWEKRGGEKHIEDAMVAYSVTHLVIERMHIIRGLLTQTLCVKRFPVIEIYRRDQYTFAIIWLALLPFALAPGTGFWAILWSSMIAYAVLGMEKLATGLADPYGRDSIDLPVAELCLRASESVLEAVDSVNWDCDHHVRWSEVDQNDRIGTVISGRDVFCRHSVASSSFPDMYEENENKQPPIAFSGPRQQKTKATFYSHMLRSVPWWVLVAITAWTVIACTLSYVARNRNPEEPSRWWTSFILVTGNITTHLSTAAFALLGFYVRAAFDRYEMAGNVWYDQLRGYCHALLSQLVSYWANAELHRGDHRRVIGHLAAIPLVLKLELRHSRDVREIKALVSTSDLARIECAESMTAHCLDVVRAYFYKVMTRVDSVGIDKERTDDNKSTNRVKMKPGRLSLIMWNDLVAIEHTAEDALHLNRCDIAPGFLGLLKTLLGLWFAILPFVLAELSGWFTILWVPIISYGLLGMYSVAAELQHPFGNDLNDLDLDKEADHIVVDLLDTYRRQPRGFDTLVRPTSESVPVWTRAADDSSEKLDDLFAEEDNLHWRDHLKKCVKLALRPVPMWMLVVIAAWSALAVTTALLVSKNFPQEGGNEPCEPWFCSAIAVDDEVKEYTGFALFMLLGFRLTDSHYRYTRALQAWQEEILGLTRLASSRWFAAYEPGTWHEGDLQRIAGHLAAYPIALMGGLRGRDYREKLGTILDEPDVQRILATCERDDYCIDVLRAYLMGAEAMLMRGERHSASWNELIRLMAYIQKLGSMAMTCVVMVRVPMAYGYVQHLRILLFIWLLLLPLGLVESSGWLAILWTVIIAYGVIGIERWSNELGDPFGFDPSDAPMERLCDHIVDAVKHDLLLYQHGLSPLLADDRPPFPAAELLAEHEPLNAEHV